MPQMYIKQIRGTTQGSILFLGTNSVVSEDYNIRWDASTQNFFINGNIQIQDGNQQQGYILTSNSSGIASWTASSSLVDGISKGVDTRSYTGGTTASVTHNLNTEDLIIQCYDQNGIQISPDTIDITGTGSVDIYFSQSLTNVKTVLIG